LAGPQDRSIPKLHPDTRTPLTPPNPDPASRPFLVERWQVVMPRPGTPRSPGAEPPRTEPHLAAALPPTAQPAPIPAYRARRDWAERWKARAGLRPPSRGWRSAHRSSPVWKQGARPPGDHQLGPQPAHCWNSPTPGGQGAAEGPAVAGECVPAARPGAARLLTVPDQLVGRRAELAQMCPPAAVKIPRRGRLESSANSIRE
jgi:hypothetical protein